MKMSVPGRTAPEEASAQSPSLRGNCRAGHACALALPGALSCLCLSPAAAPPRPAGPRKVTGSLGDVAR